MSTKIFMQINDISTSDIDKLIITLNTKGILFEGEFHFLTASIIEYNYEELELLLREYGYNGGKLLPIFSGKEQTSWTYALFDSEHIGPEIAMRLVRQKNGLSS